MRVQDEMSGKGQRITLSHNDPQIEEGAPIRVKMHGKWIRGRYQCDQTQAMSQPMVNTGDKTFVIPEGTEIEIV